MEDEENERTDGASGAEAHFSKRVPGVVLYLTTSVLCTTFAFLAVADENASPIEGVFFLSLGLAFGGVVAADTVFPSPGEEGARSRGGVRRWLELALLSALVFLSRLSELVVLKNGGILLHQTAWALLHVFYSGCSHLWQDIEYPVTRQWMGHALSIVVGFFVVFAIGSPVSVVPALLWMTFRSQADMYSVRLRLKHGENPSHLHVWSDLLTALVGLLVFTSASSLLGVSFTGGGLLFLLLLCFSGTCHAVRFQLLDAPVVRGTEAVKPPIFPYRSQMRMAFAQCLFLGFFGEETSVEQLAIFAFVVFNSAMICRLQMLPPQTDEEEVEEGPRSEKEPPLHVESV